jgi:hypothetical protein
MNRWIAATLVALAMVATSSVNAQEIAPGPGRTEITIIPGGGVFFTEDTDTSEPAFGNYDLGGAVAVNFNRYVGVEGEVSGAVGVTQSLQLGGVSADMRSPHLLNYSGNVIVSAPVGGAVVPYAAAGVGGLTMFEKATLGIAETETFLTGNVGGGLKWHAGRWGLRGDYRFMTVQSKDNAPSFFGQETRYGHRVYGAVLLNVGR